MTDQHDRLRYWLSKKAAIMPNELVADIRALLDENKRLREIEKRLEDYASGDSRNEGQEIAKSAALRILGGKVKTGGEDG